MSDLSNESLQSRLDDVIPAGAHTYSKGRDVYPSNAPALLIKGKGSKVWDNSGHRYLDYGMGLKSVVLGYSNKEVNRAAYKAFKLGNNLSRPSFVELRAAEKLQELIPGAEMVKFAKNGSNVTSAALKIARAYTGRKYICVPSQQPFFSFDDWFIGGTEANLGVPEEHHGLTLKFNYGDLRSIKSIFAQRGDDIAAVMLEPMVSQLDCACVPECNFNDCPIEVALQRVRIYLQELKRLCEKNGSLLIFDEMRTGFRWDLKGAQSLLKTTPHLSTFGKAMANGFSLSALVGIRDIMTIASTNMQGSARTFLLSSTHGAEMGPLGAFMKVVEIFARDQVSEKLWFYGNNLKKSIQELITEYKLTSIMKCSGPGVAPLIEFLQLEGLDNRIIMTFFHELMVNEGILISTISHSLAHSPQDLKYTTSAMDRVLKRIAAADLTQIPLRSSWLMGPVFRKFN